VVAPNAHGTPVGGFKRDDFKTYVSLPIETYGLAPDPAVFTPRCVANRQNETVANVLGAGVARRKPERRPARLARPMVRVPADAGRPGVGDRPDWKTRANLHLDLNPWTYGAARDGGGARRVKWDGYRRRDPPEFGEKRGVLRKRRSVFVVGGGDAHVSRR